MAHDHWFDIMSKTALRSTTRRQITQFAAVLVPGQLLSGAAGIAANKKSPGKKKNAGGKRNKKGGGKKGDRKQGNGTKTPAHLHPPEPGEDYCASYLSAVPALVPDCRDILGQCFPPDQFCIYNSQPEVVDNTYGVACCPGPKECCELGCFNLQTDRENCGACGHQCAAGELCLDRRCVCGDPRGCDVCEQNCCPAGEKLCEGIGCIPEENTCCGYSDHYGCTPRMPCCGSGDDRYCSAYLDICS
jgi:hypothetical protein